MSRYENREAYNAYFREYRKKNLARIREIGREHMRRKRAKLKEAKARCKKIVKRYGRALTKLGST